MSQWIWKFGEFEVYHNMLLHNRRQHYGNIEPVIWKLYPPDSVVCFRKQVVTTGGFFTVHARGAFSVNIYHEKGGMKKYGGQSKIWLDEGRAEITIRVGNIKSFPCIFVEGIVESDDTWLADDMTQNWIQAGTDTAYSSADMTPEQFHFEYKKVEYVKKEEINGGILFDFGKETFAGVCICGLKKEEVIIQFGESREEALDEVWSVIRYKEKPLEGSLSFAPNAFRYLYISDSAADVEAEYEYLPLTNQGSFQCNEELINRVWDVAAYTFHLNCREFFLDGIKRDRWVWSADVYQCLFVNRYLFFDKEIEKRTLIALGGKAPFLSHINTIMDYSFFWIISLYEYYKTYGDKKFLKQIFRQLTNVMNFCLQRTDDDGFIRGKQGDWVFIDWAPLDRTGALCGEQILYAKAMECYSAICRAVDAGDNGLGERAQELQKQIITYFYHSEKNVFIDSYESGLNQVTRQSNILAYLFLPCSPKVKNDIYEKVVLNGKIQEITTPYFKFYENQVHCEAGNEKMLEQSIREYYGSMLKTGATTLYEEYDPNMKGTEHYAMYGNPYEKSLCHAWSASPIYLLGRYRLGVKNTGIAYDSFEVSPRLGGVKQVEGKVPVAGGFVNVFMDEKCVRVMSTIPGGTLLVGDKSIALEPGKEVVL